MVMFRRWYDLHAAVEKEVGRWRWMRWRTVHGTHTNLSVVDWLLTVVLVSSWSRWRWASTDVRPTDLRLYVNAVITGRPLRLTLTPSVSSTIFTARWPRWPLWPLTGGHVSWPLRPLARLASWLFMYTPTRSIKRATILMRFWPNVINNARLQHTTDFKTRLNLHRT